MRRRGTVPACAACSDRLWHALARRRVSRPLAPRSASAGTVRRETETTVAPARLCRPPQREPSMATRKRERGESEARISRGQEPDFAERRCRAIASAVVAGWRPRPYWSAAAAMVFVAFAALRRTFEVGALQHAGGSGSGVATLSASPGAAHDRLPLRNMAESPFVDSRRREWARPKATARRRVVLDKYLARSQE